MSQPNKQIPNTPKRSKRKPAMEPLGWDEIVSQPGMGGYLSFLNGPIPLPHLHQIAPVADISPGVEKPLSNQVNIDPEVDLPSDSDVESVSDTPSVIVSDPGSKPESTAGLATTTKAPELQKVPGHKQPTALDSGPEVDSIPGTRRIIHVPDIEAPGAFSSPAAQSSPAIIASSPGVFSSPESSIVRRLRIRKCTAAHHGHSLGEEVLYQALWKAANSESAETRTIVIGWRGMSQLCRMTPKNCKINTQRLIRKLALEVLSPYNTPESIGTTYRIHSDVAVLSRRQARGLEWVVRSRGVDFVDPRTGLSLIAHLCTNVAD